MAGVGDTAGRAAQAPGVPSPRPRDEPGPRSSQEEEEERLGDGQRDPSGGHREEEDEGVDPRVQIELEKLNQSTDAINRLETELEEARSRFRVVLAEATAKLDEFLKKLGKSVEESKPYWEARRAARQAQVSAQKATQDFQRASEVLRAAKETIALAEERLLEQEDRHFDSAWQEMLNHATLKVMKAEQDKGRSELVHKQTAERYSVTIGHMNQLERKLKRTIKKSRPYYELKAKYYLELEHQKQRVEGLQEAVAATKGQYRAALDSLERISDEIHARRKASAVEEPRGRGVGAETTGAFSMELGFFSMDGDSFSVASDTCESDACSLMASKDDNYLESCSPCAGGAAPLPTRPPALQLAASQPGSGSMSGSSSGSGSRSSSGSGADPDSGFFSPVQDERLGPRSDCSGASSPECEGLPPLTGTDSSLPLSEAEAEPAEKSRAAETGREGFCVDSVTPRGEEEEEDGSDAAASGASGTHTAIAAGGVGGGEREQEMRAAERREQEEEEEDGADSGEATAKESGDGQRAKGKGRSVSGTDGGAAMCEASPEEEPAAAWAVRAEDLSVGGVRLERKDEEVEDEGVEIEKVEVEEVEEDEEVDLQGNIGDRGGEGVAGTGSTAGALAASVRDVAL
ncbi:LOW QUALITY PROTEIN: SH3 domain-binding protein 5 [Lethenteron reissneri]|uniref:LOW QUALITY PROTEIN: SH3 domain-binding protein 5 n=1 Tax=Lethenteron reissneri TaxID=7753 RepID=UPI002AB6C2C3|nr:LOW QUALITY PROTEIN: SH3 domain-binding protein 5 [Lethenteron reissneri]